MLRGRGDLPGGGLEAGIHIPEDEWLTSLQCLTTIWRTLRLTGVDGDGRQMRLAEYAFSSIAVDAFESTDRGSARQPGICCIRPRMKGSIHETAT